ncbi:MAG TPA: hypothetical protein VH969_12360 [Actinophytocola sp.]|jgi:hypothetical protein|uniref:hypothetical protein n=1 Tax=Actinophytocola sp. TaxID=1872138 RepID=UPI002F92BB57
MDVRALVAALLCATAVAGCGAARTAAHAGEDLAHAPRPHVEVPPAHVDVDEAAVAAREADILAAADVGADDRESVIEVACRLKAGYDLSQADEDDLVYEATMELGGDTTKGARAVALAYDLYSADDPADALGQAAVASICGI